MPSGAKIGLPRFGVTNCCKLTCRCHDLDPGPVPEQDSTAEPYLQPNLRLLMHLPFIHSCILPPLSVGRLVAIELDRNL